MGGKCGLRTSPIHEEVGEVRTGSGNLVLGNRILANQRLNFPLQFPSVIVPPKGREAHPENQLPSCPSVTQSTLKKLLVCNFEQYSQNQNNPIDACSSPPNLANPATPSISHRTRWSEQDTNTIGCGPRPQPQGAEGNHHGGQECEQSPAHPHYPHRILEQRPGH